jgi:DNA-directed RNA polymerase specialized sigma subunit
MREVRCYIRDKGWLLRLTRTAFSLHLKLNKLEAELGYFPSVEEAADLLDEREEDISKVRVVGKPVCYINDDSFNYPGSLTTVGAEIPNSIENSFILSKEEDVAEAVADKFLLIELLDELASEIAPIEIAVLKYLLEGYSQKQASEKFNVSLMKISRIREKVVLLLRKGVSLTNKV